jgi:hypothetical protein
MEHRDDWIRELERRQDNIDPIRRIPNGALFQERLINGSLRLNGIQRVGAVFLGLIGLAEGCALAVGAIAGLREGHSPDRRFLIFCPCSMWAGRRITKNALINDPTKARRGEAETPKLGCL